MNNQFTMGQRISFPSKAENLNVVEQMINKVCEEYNVNKDYYGNVLIALTEAVNNAIHHGNKSNPNKEVSLEFQASGSVLSFIIEDEGPGFDFNNLPDPTDPKNIEKPHGRGVFLMKNLADNIEFLNDGSKVKMNFNLDDKLLKEVQEDKEKENNEAT
jgi:serine/threonine-protein kinase RsbW|tara:strand:+ start:6576 stop:7049 length:474 start_codon:yes stop_codon:yes gene_type:complete